MAPTLSGFVAGATEAVDIRALEKELLRLWKSAAEAAPEGTESPVTRAAVLTLIAVVDGAAAADATTTTIARLTEHAPCRALLVQRMSDDGPPVEAFASAHCHLVSGGRQVCCEQVTLVVRPEGEPHVPGLVVPLLIPDLPTYLYWPEALRAEPPALYRALLRECDFFIVDTARAADPAAALRHLDERARSRGPGARPRDLNWSRLTAWRDLLADLFEPADRRAWLSSVRSVTIRAAAGVACDGGTVYPARPLLFAGWWIRRLRWRTRAVKPDPDGVRLEDEAGRVVDIRLEAGAGPRGRLVGVEILWHDGRRLIAEMGSGGFHVSLLDEAGAPLERSVARTVDAEDRLLCDQIDERSTDPIFAEALHEAARVASSLDSGGHAGG